MADSNYPRPRVSRLIYDNPAFWDRQIEFVQSILTRKSERDQLIEILTEYECGDTTKGATSTSRAPTKAPPTRLVT